MRKTFSVSILAAAVLLAGQPLSQHDRDFAISHLHASRKLFLDSVAGLTPEQWNFKAAPERWSIAECAEHIAISEDFIAGMIRDRIMKGPAEPEKKSSITDEAVVQKLPDRSQKFQAPEPLKPTHRWSTPDQAVAHFKESRDANIAWIRDTSEDMRSHFGPHPVFGAMDAYQWVLGMSAHTERHTAQINEVKADPNFPK